MTIGLFDAALNYIWNEVVLVLRQKAIAYGIDLFFDAAIGGPNRSAYKTDEDLSNLKDAHLIDTCAKLELISPITVKKIKHILDMRNEIAASHPNVEQIGGYELLGWLDTCVTDILQDSQSQSAIQVQSFIGNLKSYTSPIDDATKSELLKRIKDLATAHIHNLVFTFFNWYTTTDSAVLKKNISLLIPSIWNAATEEVKRKIGARVSVFRTTLRQTDLEKGLEFLGIVQGKMYQDTPILHIELENISDRLLMAHNGWDNFSIEPSIMREMTQFYHSSSDIPDAIIEKVIATILTCRLGRGYVTYCDGVSPNGKIMYDQFFSILDDKSISMTLNCIIHNSDIIDKLEYDQCKRHMLEILEILKKNIISDRLKEQIAFIEENIANIHELKKHKDFKSIMSSIC